MSSGAELGVDLRDVVSVDAAGQQLLSQMWRDGASFMVAGCAMRALIADLNAGDGEPGERRSGVTSQVEVVGKDVSGGK